MNLTPQHQHALLGAQIAADPKANEAREDIHAKYRPALDALNARASDPDDDLTEEQADERRQRINELADKTKRLMLAEAALAVTECDACELMLERLEIRCRHDVPLSQWINQTVEEQIKLEYRELLQRGLDRLHNEVSTLEKELS